MNISRLVLLLGFIVLAGHGTLAQDGPSVVMMTFDDVYISPEGDRDVMKTGRIYLTPVTDGRFRIDRHRFVDGEVERTTEVTDGDRRITINHNMEIALWGPAGTWWEMPSTVPMATLHIPDSDATVDDQDHDTAEQLKTGNVVTVGPAILIEWAGGMEDGTRVVSRQDQQSGKFVATQITLPDGSMTGEVITSAARTVVPMNTFEIPQNYTVQSVVRGGRR